MNHESLFTTPTRLIVLIFGSFLLHATSCFADKADTTMGYNTALAMARMKLHTVKTDAIRDPAGALAELIIAEDHLKELGRSKQAEGEPKRNLTKAKSLASEARKAFESAKTDAKNQSSHLANAERLATEAHELVKQAAKTK